MLVGLVLGLSPAFIVMLNNTQLLVLYAFVGLVLGLWPTFACYLRKAAAVPDTPFAERDLMTISICVLIIGFGLFVLETATAPELIGVFVLIAVIAAFHQDRIVPVYALAVFAGLLIAATLPWWHRDSGHALNLSWIELFVFMVITLVAFRVLKTNGDSLECSKRSRGIWTVLIGAFVLVATTLSFTTGFSYNYKVLGTIWHHWGAYVQSSELLISGARLFLDFPAQYGFGPTVLIALVCGDNCWRGMYYLVGLFTLLFVLLIANIALDSNKQGLLQRGIILLLCLASCFFWTGFPSDVSSPMQTPSVGGLRFLPVLALVTLLLRFDRQDDSKHYPVVWGHMAWAVAALWSIESAFFATLVWWPYYLLLCGAKTYGNRALTLGLLRALVTLVGVLVVLVLCFLAGYWLAYRSIPSGYGYFAYILNPPGPLPVDGKGAAWFFIIVMTLGIASNWQTFRQSGNSMAFRRGFLLILLAYGTFSYYISRSHDNNVLNLLPFQLLVLLNARASQIPQSWRGAVVVLLACLLGWFSIFGWDTWRDTWKNRTVVEFNPARFQQTLSYENPETRVKLLPWIGDTEAVAYAISHIRQNYGEPVTVAGPYLTSTDPGSVWSAIHNPANYISIPPERRREFLLQTANTLKLSGWVIIRKGSPTNRALLYDFDSIYSRTQEVDFGSYNAIRYTPPTR